MLADRVRMRSGEKVEKIKEFAVNDIIPATTKLKISWDSPVLSNWRIGYTGTPIRIVGVGANMDFFIRYHEESITILSTMVVQDVAWESVCGDSGIEYCVFERYVIVDTSRLSLTQRTITSTQDDILTATGLLYEDLN